MKLFDFYWIAKSIFLFFTLCRVPTINKIIPIPVRAKSIHQPDFPISCNLLAVTEILGMKTAR